MTRRAFAAAAVLLVAASAATALDERLFRIEPENPVAGSSFSMILELPDFQADDIEVVEPSVTGPAVYTGADLRPSSPDGGARVELHFTATGQGRVVIADVSLRLGRRVILLGSWAADVAADPAAAVRPPAGTWRAPETVYAYEPFALSLEGPDGRPVRVPALSLEGAVSESADAGRLRVMVTPLSAGSLVLPALSAGAGGPEAPSRRVRVLPVPAAVEATKAVGAWSVAVVKPEPGQTATVGDIVAWEVRASGRGSVALAEAPAVVIRGPDGGPVASDGAGPAYVSGEARFDKGYPAGSVSASGTFRVEKAGAYTVGVRPYAWFDAAAGLQRTASAASVRLAVSAPAIRPWAPGPGLAEAAFAALGRAAGRASDPAAAAAWSEALAAASGSDWGPAAERAAAAAGLPGEAAALPAAVASGRFDDGELLAAAAARLMAGSWAEPYYAVLALERRPFPPRLATAVADAAALSASSAGAVSVSGTGGNPGRPRDVLPAPGLLWLAAAAACVLAAICFAARGLRRSAWRWAAVAVAVMALAVATASSVERGARRFVAFGGFARSVPSELATGAFALAPGTTGRVLSASGPWLRAELDDGRAAWISVSDVGLY